jgi:pimeloyl-ACP methyl ester carboxylesterase
MAPALSTRDLLVFDQRGTGYSDALQCPALALPGVPAALAQACASQLGPERGSFTTTESADDIEAIRQATGYDRLVLFGISYGTKVALEYAERYPQHVAALVLDSVVDVNGPDPFERSTFAAMGRVLGQLCADGACAGITASPTADIAALVRRLRRRQLSGQVYDGAGHRHKIAIGRGDLFDVLLAGDENPALRALLPAAVHSALRGDPAPLLRLALLASGLTPDTATARDARATPAGVRGGLSALVHRDLAGARAGVGRQAAPGAFDQAVYLATTCEEAPFPWSPRDAPPSSRANQAARQAAALPATSVAPFDQTTALLAGPISLCLDWPVAAPPPPGPAPLPTVPALILSGAADLRTPTEDAQRVASEIPGAELFVAANTGHSVLGTELSGCAAGAVAAFFASAPLPACTPRPNPFRPTPVPPTRLAAITPVHGVGGRAGRTLAAVQDELVDLRRQIVGAAIQLGQAVPGGARFGGLRGGRALVVHGGVRLSSLSYVPGVTLSGSVPASALLSKGTGVVELRVGGSAAAHGRLRLTGGRATGTLGGHHIHVTLAIAARLADSGLDVLSPTPGLARVP